MVARRVEVAGVVGDPGQREMGRREVGGIAEVDHDPPRRRRPLRLAGALVGQGQVVGGAGAVLGVGGRDGGPVGLPGPLHLPGVVEDDREAERGLGPARRVAEREHLLEQQRGPHRVAVLGEVAGLLAQPRRVVGYRIRGLAHRSSALWGSGSATSVATRPRRVPRRHSKARQDHIS
ncbi:hypothetical protein [Actinomadura madurae]|uniref:hypothetical protein n=1 Tax=Actinomadura madurae TaxID=1993 RepID=UPI0020D2474A|nr:hypothetical protein [Actinomadura madurae]MCQ0012957.1 hypothetical protein [Actinomadura madurae]